jgi:hypothetical protein
MAGIRDTVMLLSGRLITAWAWIAKKEYVVAVSVS